MTDGILPTNLEAEESVLGAMLVNQSAISIASEILVDKDFYRDQHRTIFRVVNEMYSHNQPVDPATLADELKRRGLLEDVGNRAYLLMLSGSCPNPYNAKRYAETVRETAMRRELVEVGYNIADLGKHSFEPLEDQLDKAESLTLSIGERLRREGVKPISESVTDSLERFERRRTGAEPPGLMTGFTSLDRLSGGLQPSNLIVIGGRTSMGKTSFALNIAREVAKEDKGILIFSLEMNRLELTERLIFAESDIASNDYRHADLSEDQKLRLNLAADAISDLPILIDDTGDRTLSQMRSIARRMVSAGEAELIIVDYIQLMYGEKAGSRSEEVSKIARGLKCMAMDLRVPVLAVSQLRRLGLQSTRKEPMMEDLKESGGLENNADLVILIYRPAVDEPKQPGLEGIANINLAKNRNGPCGRFDLYWSGSTSSFIDE